MMISNGRNSKCKKQFIELKRQGNDVELITRLENDAGEKLFLNSFTIKREAVSQMMLAFQQLYQG